MRVLKLAGVIMEFLAMGFCVGYLMHKNGMAVDLRWFIIPILIGHILSNIRHE